MFRSSTILRELVQSLSKVTLLLKLSVKLRRCILCGDVAACRETACVNLLASEQYMGQLVLNIKILSIIYVCLQMIRFENCVCSIFRYP